MADYEWDDGKNAENRIKHGIGFDEAVQIFDGPVLTNVDDRNEYGELREFSFGMLGGTIVLCVVHTDRDGVVRIISARKATKKERTLFYDYLEKAIG